MTVRRRDLPYHANFSTNPPILDCSPKGLNMLVFAFLLIFIGPRPHTTRERLVRFCRILWLTRRRMMQWLSLSAFSMKNYTLTLNRPKIPKFYVTNCLVFTARRVCIARTLPLQDVCLSVCPPVCLSHAAVKTAERIVLTFFTVGQPQSDKFINQDRAIFTMADQ